MIYVKIHKGSEKIVTSLCDSELIGKTFKEGKFVLNVSEQFYKGDLVKEEEVEKILVDAMDLNIVGKRSCDIALNLGCISKENILVIQKVPHAQSILL